MIASDIQFLPFPLCVLYSYALLQILFELSVIEIFLKPHHIWSEFVHGGYSDSRLLGSRDFFERRTLALNASGSQEKLELYLQGLALNVAVILRRNHIFLVESMVSGEAPHRYLPYGARTTALPYEQGTTATWSTATFWTQLL